MYSSFMMKSLFGLHLFYEECDLKLQLVDGVSTSSHTKASKLRMDTSSYAPTSHRT